MGNWFWILILIYIFGVGYLLVCWLGKFVAENPKAFPGRKRIAQERKGDNSDGMCYHSPINDKEPENDEKCDP